MINMILYFQGHQLPLCQIPFVLYIIFVIVLIFVLFPLLSR